MMIISFMTINRAIDDCGGITPVLAVDGKDASEGGSGSEGMKQERGDDVCEDDS